ncbi:MAG: pyridoxal phosphate-dependent aminotransferase [Clostridia bacterium]|nr:pyridoxal phosphate-dependent aminotransferase [Clostridia bacterium]
MELSRKYKSISPSSTLMIDSKYKAMKASGEDVVGFGAGEPDFDTPDHIKEAAIKAINDGVTKYTPASGTVELKKAICKKFKEENGLDYDITNIVVSNGAKHSLLNAIGALVNPGDEVIFSAPYWVSYKEMVLIQDGVPVIIQTDEENGFKFTAKQLEEAITDKTKAIILNTPSNPTGMVYSEKELREIAEVIKKHDLYVISDEIYEKLVYDFETPISIAAIDEDMKNRTIIVNGVSKTFAMTGWRIGYTAANAEITKIMANVQSHYTSNPNSIAQAATVAALNGPMDSVEEMKKAFKERRNHMVERMNKIEGVSALMPEGAFYVMMNISKIKGKSIDGVVIKTSDDFANLFLEKKLVAVVPCSGFGNDDYVRWSYATSMENIDKGLDRLAEFASALK